jgi:hypothetical protein
MVILSYFIGIYFKLLLIILPYAIFGYFKLFSRGYYGLFEIILP